MSVINAIWLGVVQGLTEFLPISSSAHLILARYWFGWEIADEKQALMFDLALHLGTLLAILIYFGRDLLRFFGALFTRDISRMVERRLAVGILLGCIPAALIGALFEDFIEQFFREKILVICLFLIGVGLLMGIADRIGRKERELEQIGLGDALLIGIAQSFALLPGFSRSGITITAGLLLGLQREAAARFSFLLSAPITLGAFLWSFRHVLKEGIPQDLAMPMLAGAIASAVVGLLCIVFLLRYLRTRTLMPFVVYRLGLGIATLGRVLTG